ncbi:terminase GpA (plasmid) [Stanieria cyanosphaera PCC 7437]|uniref:Terminase GpA n=1 Tax=Stanieria cyanosphaera (strain ATCC 29371 / PCC 7437) TaxID=111780 RepID=K9Y240_STAC7|nr:phage terminase large subunit family protein [Stanieria cyanosphaera]AFZ38404.1 terminase GpA [Stanieria cyanosphaera PCC 7437]
MDADTLLKQVKSKFLKPVAKILVSDWCEKHLQLPQTSAEPGLWRRDRAPYQSGLMDAVCESHVRKVTIMTSAQTGKSTICNAIIARYIDIDPCPIMFTQPTIQLAQRYSKEKLSPMISDIKVLSDKIIQAERNAASTILMKLFKGGLLCLSGANSPASLASMSIRLLLCDEIDKYPANCNHEGDPVDLAIQRTTTYWNYKVILVSTPSIKGASRIEDSYEKSDKRLFFVPCPHCGYKQHLVWERIQYSGKGSNDFNPDLGVYYICESCETPIAESYKSSMVRSGEWIATAKPENANHVGFHCNRLISPWVNWIDMAYDYETSKHDPLQLQVFVNSSLGLPFEHNLGDSLDWEKLHQRSEASTYQRGQIPDGVLMLTAGVDVQGDRLEVSIWGYGRGEQSWLIDHHQILGNPLENEVWQQLVNVITKPYLLPNDCQIKTIATCVDSGYLTQDVYNQVRKLKHLHVFAIKGQAGSGKLFVNRPRHMDITHKGRVIHKGIQLYVLGVDSGKEVLYYRSKIETPGSKYINFPKGLDTNYFQGFCSEVQVKKHRAGQNYFVWEKLAGIHNNEPLDCALYSLAAAHLVGITRMNWSQLEASFIPPIKPENDNVDNKKTTTFNKSISLKKRNWSTDF